MAVGSSRRNIIKIMFQESLLLFFIAAIPAILICFNMQKLEFISADQMDLTFGRFIINTCVTSGLLIAVILLGNWYPSYRASRISPADALHYE
jgi:putative ABC transport system permease protein